MGPALYHDILGADPLCGSSYDPINAWEVRSAYGVRDLPTICRFRYPIDIQITLERIQGYTNTF